MWSFPAVAHPFQGCPSVSLLATHGEDVMIKAGKLQQNMHTSETTFLKNKLHEKITKGLCQLTAVLL